jgi:hypothetical protein
MVRVFYFDFLPEAPGPVVGTTAEVVDALKSLPEHRQRYANRHAAFGPATPPSRRVAPARAYWPGSARPELRTPCCRRQSPLNALVRLT